MGVQGGKASLQRRAAVTQVTRIRWSNLHQTFKWEEKNETKDKTETKLSNLEHLKTKAFSGP